MATIAAAGAGHGAQEAPPDPLITPASVSRLRHGRPPSARKPRSNCPRSALNSAPLRVSRVRGRAARLRSCSPPAPGAGSAGTPGPTSRMARSTSCVTRMIGGAVCGRAREQPLLHARARERVERAERLVAAASARAPRGPSARRTRAGACRRRADADSCPRTRPGRRRRTAPGPLRAPPAPARRALPAGHRVAERRAPGQQTDRAAACSRRAQPRPRAAPAAGYRLDLAGARRVEPGQRCRATCSRPPRTGRAGSQSCPAARPG